MSRDTQAIAKAIQTLLRSGKGKASAGWLVLGCVLLGGYLFAEPWLEQRWGVDLPGVHQGPGAAPPVVRQDQPSKPPVAERSGKTQPPASIETLIRSDRETYVSPAGLRYSRGTVHGHHLRHLMAHTADAAERPVHGVFDSTDVLEVVGLVDEAYRNAVAGRRSSKRTEGDRTVYEVNMGRRVGYIGGKSGQRKGHPAARHVQIVLVRDKFITAYPVLP